jgi:hypothetical protein
MPALSEKQKRFVSEYLIDLNATQAAIRAGYSAKTAQQQGSIFNGGLYEGKDPGPNVDGIGTSWLYRFADRLRGSAQYDRVIMVPVGMGSAAARYFAPNGVVGNFIPVAVKRLASLGLPVTAFLWQQGERDGGEGTSTAQYADALRSIMQASRDAGSVAPWLIGKSTYQGGVISNSIRLACDQLVNNADVFPGADTDTLVGTTYREAGLTHFNSLGCEFAAALWQTALNVAVS